ncbi:MAG: M1 aminopeptidase family protein [Planctomycetota bacterium]|jgi:hypothetical protein
MASLPLLISRKACAGLFLAALFAAPVAAAQLPGDDKANAPAPLEVNGLVGMPIDILSTSAKIVFDLEKQEAHTQATMVFEMTADGMPLFDLRQDIASAKFNGEAIEVGKLAQHDLGESSGPIRILQVEAEAGKTHTLELEYLLKKPQSPAALEIGWGDGTLDWDFFFSDLNHGRYLEMWFPANLLFDRLAVDVEFEIVGTDVEHEIVTNGTVEELGPLHWKLTFPPHFTAFSHMLVVIPSKRVERKESTFKLPNGDKVTVDVVVREDAGVTLKEVAKQVVSDMKDFHKGMGPWPHGDRVTVFVWSGSRSMEYDGATTTAMGALRHELHHSWFGRGVKPQDQNAGWWDEAWTVYYSDHGRAPKSQVKREGSPVALSPADPWNRKTPMLSYSAGSMLFSRIALEIGEKKLVKHMSSFYTENALQVATTQDLEAHLVAESGNKEIHQLFHRYVYGKKGRYDAAE